MSQLVYRYTFADKVSMTEVQLSLVLSVFCAEGLHGRGQVRMDAGVAVDEGRRVCVVDAARPAGRSVALIFTELLQREFGEDAFTVEALGARASVETAEGNGAA